MDYIVIQGVKPYDGRYEFDLGAAELTTREWGWVKRHANYLPLNVSDGLRGGDPELFAVFAAIALRRAGKVDTGEVPDVIDRFADSPFGATITLDSDGAEEADALPPPASSSSSSATSGDASTTNSETSEPTPPASGIPASATSESGPLRSVS